MDLDGLAKFKRYKNDWDWENYYISHPIKSRPQNQKRGVRAERKRASFQATMETVLVLGQCFGLVPVIGICQLDAYKLKFKVFSWRCMYSLISFTFQFIFVFLLILSVFKNILSGVAFATHFIFYSTNALLTSLFLRIASKWPKLCMHIAKMESVDPNTNTQIRRSCNMACFVVLTLGLLEHVFAELYFLGVALDCEPHRNTYEAYVIKSYPWIYEYIPYNHFVGFFSHILSLQFIFIWNYANVFVICISLYLASRLEHINQRIAAVKGTPTSSSFWRKMREDYNRAVQLVRYVDDIIGAVTFIAFGNNMFFICLQLLSTLGGRIGDTASCSADDIPDQSTIIKPLLGYEYPVYFAYSFVFLVVRSLMVALAAARVHTASRAPAHALYDVSSSAYCGEVQRFVEQIHGDNVALSGLQFFNVKRGIVLTIAGTIVTYELVLLQVTGITPA